MPTRTACRDNVVSANDQTVRCHKKDSPTPENNDGMEMVDQPFTASEIGESMDADLLPELSGETWVASALTEEFTADLPAGSNIDLIVESRSDDKLAVVRGWIQSNFTPAWTDCAGLSPELRCWRLHIGNFVHRYRRPVMAKTSTTGGGFSTGGPP